MLTFWIIVVGLTLLALAFVVPPLLKRNSNLTDVDRNTLNVAIYKERLRELEQENLTPEQLAQAKQELEKTLAQDLDSSKISTHPPRARWASIVMVIAIPVLAIGGYWQMGAWHLVASTPSTEMGEQSGNAPPDVNQMVAKLAKRLEMQPDDLKGWQMLARSYTVLGDSAKAIQMYEKILARFGEDQKALWFLGVTAMEKADYIAAIDYLQRLLKQVPPDNEKVRSILEEHIAEARQLAQDVARIK